MPEEDGAGFDAGEDDFDAAAAFYKDMHPDREGADVHSDEENEAPDDAATESRASEATEGDADPDDTDVEWGSGEAAHKAKMRDLKAAYLERSATESLKSETTQLRERASASNQRAVAALDKLVTQAKEAYKPYETMDWYAAMRDLEPAEFDALRRDASERAQQVKFLTSELDGLIQEGQKENARVMAQRAQEAIAELSKPETGIPNFGKEVWGQIVDHAVAMGAPKAAVEGIVDPWAIKLIYQSMLYKTGQAKAAEKIAKVVNKPTNLTAPSRQGSPSKAAEGTKALAKIRGGSKDSDDIAAAFYENLMKERA